MNTTAMTVTLDQLVPNPDNPRSDYGDPFSQLGSSSPSTATWRTVTIGNEVLTESGAIIEMINAGNPADFTGNGLAATYVACKPDYGPTASSREAARKRADWRYVEVDGGQTFALLRLASLVHHQAVLAACQVDIDIGQQLGIEQRAVQRAA